MVRVLSSKDVEGVGVDHAGGGIRARDIERRAVIPSARLEIEHFYHVEHLAHEPAHNPHRSRAVGSAVASFGVFHIALRVVVALVIVQGLISVDAAFNPPSQDIRSIR